MYGVAIGGLQRITWPHFERLRDVRAAHDDVRVHNEDVRLVRLSKLPCTRQLVLLDLIPQTLLPCMSLSKSDKVKCPLIEKIVLPKPSPEVVQCAQGT